MVGGQVAFDEKGLVQVGFVAGADVGMACGGGLHRQIADIVLINLEFEFLLDRLGMKARHLREYLVDLSLWYPVSGQEPESDVFVGAPQLQGAVRKRGRVTGQHAGDVDHRNLVAAAWSCSSRMRSRQHIAHDHGLLQYSAELRVQT